MKQIKYIIFSLLILLSFTMCAQKQDKIVGVWTVTNEYNKGVYEIVESEGKFYGKIHKYSENDKEYLGNNKEEDYFLTDVGLTNGKYINGIIHIDEKTTYRVEFSFDSDDVLKVVMTINNEPYTELWTRKK